MTVLGIDGGGSKTTFLLENDSSQEVAKLETGPSNWVSSDTERVRGSLADGIQALPQKPDVVCGGFAGAGRPQDQAFYRECLQGLLPAAQIFIETDATIAYFGALGQSSGVLLVAGTGSIALARKASGALVRVGGWGPVFGDEGGGFWLGKTAVAKALHSHDSGTFPEFVSMIASELRLPSVAEVPSAWKRGSLDVARIAGLARFLLDNLTNELAAEIVREGAAHLRTLAEGARRRAELPTSCPRVASGSVALHPLIQSEIGLQFVPAMHSPARGAILLARDRMRLHDR